MECYYIVISSSHLSKGHFRNIKGVFRGPLTASKTLDFAEKENTGENALEALKANFYCALCDKQYHKHQEFDNHINSYDHAHKQRLKELKQREFSRNVASKLRRNERKQKKYLQRLHKLADHKREATCAPGSGPMFKSTTVTVHDHIHGSLQGTIVRSAERDNPQFTSIVLASSESSQNKQDHRTEKVSEQKISFSFAFPKKTRVKLEASAAVFYEFNEDVSGSIALNKVSGFVPGPFRVPSPLPIDVTTFPLTSEKCMPTCKRTNSPQDTDQKQTPEKQFTTSSLSDVCNVGIPLSYDDQAQSVNANNFIYSQKTLREHQPCGEKLAGEVHKLEAAGMEPSDSIDQTLLDDELQKERTVFHDSEMSNNSIENQTDNVAKDLLPYKVHEKFIEKEIPQKRPEKAFYPVQNKDGSKVLQWPSEMMIYTCTQPSISYSCNPLHFDFRSSKPVGHREQPFSQDNGLFNHNIENDPNDHSKITCTTQLSSASLFSQGSESLESPPHHVTKTLSNLKCYNLICSIKEGEKHNVSKYFVDRYFDLDVKQKRKSHRACYSPKGKRQKKCKHKVRVSQTTRCKHRLKCCIRKNCQSGLKTSEQQHVQSKGSFGSLKNVPFSNQPPHAGSYHTERESLRRPMLKIKQKCAIWNVDHEKGFTNQTENEQCKNTGSFNYQSKLLQLDHCSQNLACSQTFCSWSYDKNGSNHGQHETFLKHSCTFKRACISVIDEIELSFKKPRLCKSFTSSEQVNFPDLNFSSLWRSITVAATQVADETISSKARCCKLSTNKPTLASMGEFLSQYYCKFENESPKVQEFLKKFVKLRIAVEDKLDQLCTSFLDLDNQTSFRSTDNEKYFTNGGTQRAEKTILGASTSSANKEHNSTLLPCASDPQQQCKHQSPPPSEVIADQCGHETQKHIQVNTRATECQKVALSEMQMNTKTYIAEKLVSETFVPMHLTRKYCDKLKYHQSVGYIPVPQPNVHPNRFKLVLPTMAIQACTSLYPVQLEVPFCAASITSLQHNLPQHLPVPFPVASVDCVSFTCPQQQFLCPQAQGISRTPFYNIMMEPGLCVREPFSTSPQVPLMGNTVLCHVPAPLPHVSHTAVFSPFHSQLPIPIHLHSLF